MWSDGMHFIELSENLVRDRFLLSGPNGARRTDLANDTCLWEPKLLLRVGNRAAGTCVASSPDSDLEAFSHNPAHGSFAPLAFQPSAMTNCANQRFLSSKGSIGHAFTVRIRTENQNQTSFYPFVPHEISVLVELILGHLRYLLTDVPPQPNSPPDNVLRPDRPADASLGSKRRGCYPASGSRNDEAFGYLKRVIVTPADYPRLVEFLHFDIQSTGQKSHCVSIRRDHRNAFSELAVRRPKKLPRELFPVRPPADTRRAALAALAARAVRQQSTVRPGVSGTRSSGFSRAAGMHRHHATCGALPAAGPYLRLSRFQGGQAICTDGRSARARALGFAATAAPSYSSRPGSCPDGRSFAPIPKSDERFARQYRCGPPPEFPLASPRSGIVHHLSGPDRHAHTRTLLRRSRSVGSAPVRDPTNQLPYALRVYSPVDSHTCQTPWSVFQDGSNGEPTGRRPEHADAEARREARAADHD
ncbi:hypothetical protein Bca101_101924 [Brassica carinata]